MNTHITEETLLTLGFTKHAGSWIKDGVEVSYKTHTSKYLSSCDNNRSEFRNVNELLDYYKEKAENP